MTGIDVYSDGPFPIEEGSRVYAGDAGDRHTDLLVIRLEDLARVGIDALAAFYDRPLDTIPQVNTGDEQSYADRYRAFKKGVRLPSEWVAWQLNSQFARYFYGYDERAVLAERWSGNASLVR